MTNEQLFFFLALPVLLAAIGWAFSVRAVKQVRRSRTLRAIKLAADEARKASNAEKEASAKASAFMPNFISGGTFEAKPESSQSDAQITSADIDTLMALYGDPFTNYTVENYTPHLKPANDRLSSVRSVSGSFGLDSLMSPADDKATFIFRKAHAAMPTATGEEVGGGTDWIIVERQTAEQLEAGDLKIVGVARRGETVSDRAPPSDPPRAKPQSKATSKSKPNVNI